MDPVHRRFYREGFWDGITTAALAVCALLLSASCEAPPPMPGPVLCDAAVRCGIYGSDPAEQERVRALCEASWEADNAPPRTGISSDACIAVILRDYTLVCPFLEDPRAPLPPECVQAPTTAEVICQAADACGALQAVNMSLGRCVETFDPAPLVAGVGSDRCAAAVLADYQILCPFLMTGDATTIPEECQTE